MMQGEERGRLDQVPEPYQVKAGTSEAPTPRTGSEAPQAPASAGGTSSFELNYPSIISLLYLSSFLLFFTAIVGGVLAYVWKNEPHEAWMDSHYQYLINTFWIGFIGTLVGFILLIVLVGFLVLPLVAVWVIVRSVLSLINAQQHKPMPNPGTMLA